MLHNAFNLSTKWGTKTFLKLLKVAKSQRVFKISSHLQKNEKNIYIFSQFAYNASKTVDGSNFFLKIPIEINYPYNLTSIFPLDLNMRRFKTIDNAS